MQFALTLSQVARVIRTRNQVPCTYIQLYKRYVKRHDPRFKPIRVPSRRQSDVWAFDLKLVHLIEADYMDKPQRAPLTPDELALVGIQVPSGTK